MIPVKYWDFWIWITLVFTVLNVYFFFTGGGIISLLLAAFCGFGFWTGVKA